jgi:iron(III) transport system permease protein
MTTMVVSRSMAEGWAGRVARLSPFQLFALALASVMVLLVIGPILYMVTFAFGGDGTYDFSAFAVVAGSADFWRAAGNTALVLLFAIPLSVAAGFLFAWLGERTDARMGLVSTMMPLVPLLVPSIAVAIGWIFLASEQAGLLNVAFRAIASSIGIHIETGPLNILTWPGLVFLYVVFLIPFTYLMCAAGLRNIDPSLEEASRMCRAGTLRTLRLIAFPVIRPAIGAASLLALMMGLALFSTPVVIGTPARVDVLSVYLVRLVKGVYPPRLAEAVVIGMLIMVVLLVAWILHRRYVDAGRHGTLGGKGVRPAPTKLGVWRRPAQALMLLYLMVTSIFPLLALLLVAMQPFWQPTIDWSVLSLDAFREIVFENRTTQRALQISISLGLIGGVLGMLIASILVMVIHRHGGFLGRFIDFSTKIPGALSHIVIGVAFVVTFAGPPFMLQGTWLVLMMAYLVINLPQASISADAAIRQVGRELWEASYMSGAGSGRTFFRVALPLMRPGLAAGFALLFVLMVGDLTASALLAGTRNPVVGFVILNIWENGVFGELAALAVVITVLTSTAVLISQIAGRTKWNTK